MLMCSSTNVVCKCSCVSYTPVVVQDIQWTEAAGGRSSQDQEMDRRAAKQHGPNANRKQTTDAHTAAGQNGKFCVFVLRSIQTCSDRI